MNFTPGPFTSGEAVTIAVQLYRRTAGGKTCAVRQGYDTGHAGVATDYGVNRRHRAPRPARKHPSISVYGEGTYGLTNDYDGVTEKP
ncbi:hypothetical protein QMK19_40085 [Streptomyces sp. H10-C2]|uniref:hypothetical protein n=1 Tax=unclassified Streptomyces TaxID=2593676 RepID=UPI0024BB707E|nr:MULTISPECIES: hypothetical protein [unclassified Streptomyces]MDJ0347377.1 hypothetical protein [Streptomyces sp. PH10-H1]MDJ0375620.1 hypothetical protein [Streptomyces sp. H10-C2]